MLNIKNRQKTCKASQKILCDNDYSVICSLHLFIYFMNLLTS